MNTGEILIFALIYLFVAVIFFRLVFIKKDDEGKFTIVINKFRFTLFGKVLSITLCFPIFILVSIFALSYFAVIKRK